MRSFRPFPVTRSRRSPPVQIREVAAVELREAQPTPVQELEKPGACAFPRVCSVRPLPSASWKTAETSDAVR